MTVSPDSALFDPFGVPAGKAGERFWRELVSSLFTRIEKGGWDQPNALWAVLGPVATAALSEAGTLRDVLEIDDPDGVHTLYGIQRLTVFQDNGRRTLTSIIAPPGTAALILLTEAWRTSVPLPDGLSPEEARESSRRFRMPDELRPSQSPDRIEMRQATVMEPDGTQCALSYDRGQDPADPDTLDLIVGENLSGVLVDLMRRCYQLPVEPDSSVGEIMGTVTLLAITQVIEQNPDADSPTLLFTLMHMAAQLIDTLDSPYTPHPGDRELAAIFHGSPNLADQLPEMIENDATGPLYLAARRVARMSWEDFFTRPGANRWLRTDDQDQPLTPALREWYGTGHLSRFIEQRLPPWGQALAGLHAARPDLASFIAASVHEFGWGPPTRR